MNDRNKLIKEHKQLAKVLSKMCEYVNIKLEDVDFNDEQWFMRYEWEEDQMFDFAKWLKEEILNDKELRRELFNISYKPSKRMAEVYANGFVFNYGWKTKWNSEKN